MGDRRGGKAIENWLREQCRKQRIDRLAEHLMAQRCQPEFRSKGVSCVWSGGFVRVLFHRSISIPMPCIHVLNGRLHSFMPISRSLSVPRLWRSCPIQNVPSSPFSVESRNLFTQPLWHLLFLRKRHLAKTISLCVCFPLLAASTIEKHPCPTSRLYFTCLIACSASSSGSSHLFTPPLTLPEPPFDLIKSPSVYSISIFHPSSSQPSNPAATINSQLSFLSLQQPVTSKFHDGG